MTTPTDQSPPPQTCSLTVFFCGTLLLFLLLGRTSLLRDPGSFWHTAVGEKILRTGTMPVIDTWTHTFGGERWIAHQWLSECVMALADRLGGFDGLLLTACLVLAWMSTGVALRLREAGLIWLLVTLLLALVFAASAYTLHARPHLATMWLLSVSFSMLIDVENGRRPVSQLWWLIPLFALWTNLHGGTVGGLCTAALVVLGWLVAWLAGLESPFESRRDVTTAGAALALCVVSTLANPYGGETPRTWLAILAAPLPELIVEHAPLQLQQPAGQMVLLLGGVYSVVLLGLRRCPRATWMLPVVWLVLATLRIRHAPLFAIVSALAIADMLPHTRWFAGLQSRGYVAFGPGELPPLSRHGALWVVSVVAIVSVSLCHSWGSRPVALWAAPEDRVWPAAMLPELQAFAADRPQTRLFNEMHFGGFLMANVPELPTFIDDRCELFGEEFLIEYRRAESNPEEISEWIARYGIEAALTRPGSGFDRYFAESRRWRVSIDTEFATFYVLLPIQPSTDAEPK